LFSGCSVPSLYTTGKKDDKSDDKVIVPEKVRWSEIPVSNDMGLA
jgi:hypothetical protein